MLSLIENLLLSQFLLFRVLLFRSETSSRTLINKNRDFKNKSFTEEVYTFQEVNDTKTITCTFQKLLWKMNIQKFYKKSELYIKIEKKTSITHFELNHNLPPRLTISIKGPANWFCWYSPINVFFVGWFKTKRRY